MPVTDGADLEPAHASNGKACTAGPAGSPCRRCEPTKHGAYARPLQLQPRLEELAEWVRDQMGELYDPRFEGVIATTAIAGARAERALIGLDAEADGKFVEHLDRSARAWVREFLTGLGHLGLTPASAEKLGLNRARRETLDRYLADEYVEGGEAKGPDGG